MEVVIFFPSMLVPARALATGGYQSDYYHSIYSTGSHLRRGCSGNLEALNALNGTVLWSTNVGVAIGQVQASAGTLYVETFGANGLTSYHSGGGGPSFFLVRTA